MANYSVEPAHTHGMQSRIGVLLVNLGTPSAPNPSAVRRYLNEFLSDRRVVEIPSWIWKPILHGYILRTRPAQSAAKYAAIWTAEGSPLLVHSKRQAQILQGLIGGRLKAKGLAEDYVRIVLAMRYGEPAIAAALQQLKKEHCNRLLLLPLYPQYAASTTGSAFDQVFAELQRYRYVPALRTVANYHDDAGYIAALAAQVGEYWMKHGRPDKLLLSFHGLPRFALERGDPYHCQCQKTARLFAEKLGLKPEQYQVVFQSRFGRTEWLKPYANQVLRELGQQGLQRVDVFCPGFTSDCLETLEEIALQGKKEFIESGGKELRYIPCLNEQKQWLIALCDLAWRELHNWLETPLSEADLHVQKSRAQKLGALQ